MKLIRIVYHSAAGANLARRDDTEKSITGVMFNLLHPANPQHNPLQPVLQHLPANLPTAALIPKQQKPTTQPGKKSKKAKKNGPRKIRGGTYKEYISHDYKTLQDLCKLRGLAYHGKKWTALLLSLSDQGKLSKPGRFSVHIVGDFVVEDDMDSEEKVSILLDLDYETDRLLMNL